MRKYFIILCGNYLLPMTEFLLPFDLLPAGGEKEAEDIYLLPYQSRVVRIKSKVTFKYNVFSFLLEGGKSVYFGGRNTETDPTKFMLLSAGNCMMSERTAAGSGNYRSILLFFDNKLLADFFAKHPPAQKAGVGKGTGEPFLVFENDAFIANYLQSLALMLAAEPAPTGAMRRVKLEELLLYINSRYPGDMLMLQHASREIDMDTEIRRVASANISTGVTVEELAFLCNASLSTFKRRFARIYGTSPNKWLLQKRMEIAADMLKRGELKASEIYYKVGYENLSSFVQSFKQVYGTTPKKYQAMN